MTRDGARYVFLNDSWVAPDDAAVSFEDRGFQLADGVYEVVRVYGGRPFALSPHLRRLQRSGTEIGLAMPKPTAFLAGIVAEAARRRGLDEAQVYVQLTRGVAPRVHHFPPSTAPTLVVYASPAPRQPPEAYEQGVATVVVPDERWLRCDIKSIALLPNALAKQQARGAGAVEALLEREGVGMTEGSSSNLFIVSEGRLVTAPAGRYILAGITRDIVLDLARSAGLPVDERFFDRAQLLAADEAFLTSTNMEVLPIRTVDGAPIGSGRPGPVTRRLAGLYGELIAAARRGEGRE